MFTNSIAKAKLVFNKKLQTYKLVCAFNVYETTKQFDKTVYKFPVQKKCDFVSGDINKETLHTDLLRVLSTASKVLRTNNIQIVE
jgi:hypothetical protein